MVNCVHVCTIQIVERTNTTGFVMPKNLTKKSACIILSGTKIIAINNTKVLGC